MIVLEAGVGSLVLVAAALLSNTPPARGPLPTGEPTAGATGTSRSGAVGDVVVSVSASPNQPGLNGFTVLAASNRRPAPAPIGQVRLGLTGAVAGQTVALHRIGTDRYFAAAPVGARLADVEVLVHRAGRTLRLRLPWRLTQRTAPARPPTGTPLARYTDPLAIALLVAGAGVAVLVARTRRRPAEAGGSS
jgi:copper transport protein